MQKNWFKLICLCTFLLMIVTFAEAKNTSRILAGIRISATLNKLSQHAEVRWNSLSGQNNLLRFELQKSADGNTFSYVTSVGCSSNHGKPYFAEDRNMQLGNNFYRLRIIYKDGGEGYSSVTQVSSPVIPPVTILPTVADEKLYLWLTKNNQVTSASITDASGKIIREHISITAEAGMARIDVKNLPAGFYNIIIQTALAEKLHLKFTKK